MEALGPDPESVHGRRDDLFAWNLAPVVPPPCEAVGGRAPQRRQHLQAQLLVAAGQDRASAAARHQRGHGQMRLALDQPLPVRRLRVSGRLAEQHAPGIRVGLDVGEVGIEGAVDPLLGRNVGDELHLDVLEEAVSLAFEKLDVQLLLRAEVVVDDRTRDPRGCR